MKKISFKKYKIIIFIFLFFIFLFSTKIVKAQTEEKNKIINPLTELQIKIPGLEKIMESSMAASCSINEQNQTICSLPWISIYIKAIYNYSMGIIGILAALALMIGGVIYLVSAGNTTRISQAKSWMTGGITGILIMFTSYILLNEINPDLIALKPIKLEIIKEYEDDEPYPEVYPPIDNSEIPWDCSGCVTIKGNNIINAINKKGDIHESDISPIILSKLQNAANDPRLKENDITIIVTSAFRSLKRQLDQMAEDSSKACNLKKIAETNNYDPMSCPHTSARALDIWAFNSKTGVPYVGTPPNTTRCKKSGANECRKNEKEKILHTVLYENGFCNIPFESWHYEYMIDGKGVGSKCGTPPSNY